MSRSMRRLIAAFLMAFAVFVMAPAATAAPIAASSSAATAEGGPSDAPDYAPDSPDGVTHNVACTLSKPKVSFQGTRVLGSGNWRCNGSVDINNSSFCTQYYKDGAWRNIHCNYFNSTAPNGNMSRSSEKINGCWDYRTRAIREAFHGNWNTLRHSSDSQRSCR